MELGLLKALSRLLSCFSGLGPKCRRQSVPPAMANCSLVGYIQHGASLVRKVLKHLEKEHLKNQKAQHKPSELHHPKAAFVRQGES